MSGEIVCEIILMQFCLVKILFVFRALVCVSVDSVCVDCPDVKPSVFVSSIFSFESYARESVEP